MECGRGGGVDGSGGAPGGKGGGLIGGGGGGDGGRGEGGGAFTLPYMRIRFITADWSAELIFVMRKRIMLYVDTGFAIIVHLSHIDPLYTYISYSTTFPCNCAPWSTNETGTLSWTHTPGVEDCVDGWSAHGGNDIQDPYENDGLEVQNSSGFCEKAMYAKVLFEIADATYNPSAVVCAS